MPFYFSLSFLLTFVLHFTELSLFARNDVHNRVKSKVSSIIYDNDLQHKYPPLIKNIQSILGLFIFWKVMFVTTTAGLPKTENIKWLIFFYMLRNIQYIIISGIANSMWMHPFKFFSRLSALADLCLLNFFLATDAKHSRIKMKLFMLYWITSHHSTLCHIIHSN